MKLILRTALLAGLLSLAATPLASRANPDDAGSDPRAGQSGEMVYPRIDGVGGVYPIEGTPAVPAGGARLVLDATGKQPKDKAHPSLTHAARALNLYGQAGVPKDQVAVAVVVHGKATPLALSDEAYQRHFGRPNPNSELLKKLESHGVKVLLCGQSMHHSGYSAEEIAAPVEVELSAMTSLARLQNEGYALVP